MIGEAWDVFRKRALGTAAERIEHLRHSIARDEKRLVEAQKLIADLPALIEKDKAELAQWEAWAVPGQPTIEIPE
jgi:hypothetical protein